MAVDIGTVLLQWEQSGVFEFLFPLLLIFAIVFGILTATNVFGSNKGLHVIIALVVAFMAIGYSNSIGYSLGAFLSELFPRLAIGLAVLLTLMILTGFFIKDDEDFKKWWYVGFSVVGLAIAIVIVTKSFDRYGWSSSFQTEQYLGWIIGALLIIGLIIAVSVSGNKGKDDDEVVVRRRDRRV